MRSEFAQSFDMTFSALSDPRSSRNKTYPMNEILFVVLCGSVCGAESWRDFVEYGNAKIDFLKQYFPFEAGVPCKNTFARLFSALNPQAFKSCFIEWVKDSFKTYCILGYFLPEIFSIYCVTICHKYITKRIMVWRIILV